MIYNKKVKHLAILKQPFLDLIVNGIKTIETRWSKNRIAPFCAVKAGDLILMKETGKDITASAVAERVEFLELTPEIAEEIRAKYEQQICIHLFTDWEVKKQKRYVTLIFLKDVKKIPPQKAKRSNGAGWIILGD